MILNLDAERLRRRPYSSGGLVESALFVVRRMRAELDALEALLLEQASDLQPGAADAADGSEANQRR